MYEEESLEHLGDGRGGADEMHQDREAELEAACTAYGREVTREIFDTLEERIVAQFAAQKLELAKVLAKFRSSSFETMTNAERQAIRVEMKQRVDEARGMSMIAAYIGFLSESEFHGAHRRQLATLTVQDILSSPEGA